MKSATRRRLPVPERDWTDATRAGVRRDGSIRISNRTGVGGAKGSEDEVACGIREVFQTTCGEMRANA